jgi:hypothetical protein
VLALALALLGCDGFGTDGNRTTFGYARTSFGMCAVIHITPSLIQMNFNILSFRPGMHNSVAGVTSTLSTVYGSNNKLVFTGSSKMTLFMTGGLTISWGTLFLLYQFLLQNLTKKHDKEYGKRWAGQHGDGTGLDVSGSEDLRFRPPQSLSQTRPREAPYKVYLCKSLIFALKGAKISG